MNFNEILVSFTLSLITNFVVMVGATSFFYWVNSSTATPFVVAHRQVLALVTGFGFMAYLFAQMLSDGLYEHLRVGYHWTYLNMMILTIYILNMQLGLRWQALLDGVLIAVYYLVFGAPYSIVGITAVVVAAAVLYIVQADSARLIAQRRWKYGLLDLFAAAMLVMEAQLGRAQLDSWFWVRQILALCLLAPLCLEFEEVMRLTRQRSDQLERLVSTDELTGVQNFGTFNKELARCYTEYQKHGTPYSVFEGDLDHFKHINDTYGHPSGNLVLKRLAMELEAYADTMPFPAKAFRLGGEEFAIIAQSELNHEQATEIGERFLKLLSLVKFADVDPDLVLTCSIGQAHVQPGDYSGDDVYKHANRYLYEAKRGGRNRIKAQEDGVEAG
jgi:diguanylate cyclase (GGDEF)-like protein